MNNRS